MLLLALWVVVVRVQATATRLVCTPFLRSVRALVAIVQLQAVHLLALRLVVVSAQTTPLLTGRVPLLLLRVVPLLALCVAILLLRAALALADLTDFAAAWCDGDRGGDGGCGAGREEKSAVAKRPYTSSFVILDPGNRQLLALEALLDQRGCERPRGECTR